MTRKRGKQTFVMENDICIKNTYSIVGPEEAKGSFKDYYDHLLDDDLWECKSYEKAEIKLHKEVIDGVLKKDFTTHRQVDCIFGGDLLNQIISSSFSAREFEIPFVGLYGACSTFGESLATASMIMDGDFMQRTVCATSSHYGTAERQYRFPLELGTQPTPTSQWTVTGAGAVLLEKCSGNFPKIKSVTLGKVIDYGINDAANMGAAMAPAAYDTIHTHLKDMGRSPDYYDLIITGDLGKYGLDLIKHFAETDGLNVSNIFDDCGARIYTSDQNSGQGGSGAGCSAVVYSGYLHKELMAGNLHKILLVPTGALLSRLSTMQGESIPAIAHAIDIEM
ncbi:MAG: stage V sporulation protein AD [Clostridia bacterium]|nr:stage V sporulation protein AD [Clostridia bacterium]